MSRLINPWPQHDGPSAPYAFGTVFFGLPNQDPVGNPKAPFSDSQLLVDLNATQTLDSKGMYNTAIYLNGSYSMSLFDVDGNQVRTEPEISGAITLGSTNKNKETVTDMLADLTSVTDDFYSVEDYATGHKSGVLFFKFLDGPAPAPDGGSQIDHDTLNGHFVQNFPARIYFKAFGGNPDGSTGNRVAWDNAVAYCQIDSQALYLGIGEFALETMPSLAGKPIAIVGEDDATWQQGSTLPATTLVWTGGATPMLDCASADWSFIGFAVENRGTATDFIEFIAGAIRPYFKDMSFVNGSGHTLFSRSIIRSSGNRIGYARFSHIICLGPAPVFIDIDGLGTANGITPITIDGRSIFESNAGNAMTIVKVKDETLDALVLRDITANQQANELTMVDTFDTPAAVTINVLTLENIEWDKGSGVGAINDVALKLENVPNCIIRGGNWNGNAVTNIGDLRNTNVDIKGVWWRSVAGLFFKADSDSYVSESGANFRDKTNTNGMTDVSSRLLAYSDQPVIFPDEVNPSASNLFTLKPDDAVLFTINAAITIASSARDAQIIVVKIQNESGGAINNGQFNSSQFKTTGALTAPANGFHRSYKFFFDGTIFVEDYRDPADIAN